jgi:hypothetical protein
VLVAVLVGVGGTGVLVAVSVGVGGLGCWWRSAARKYPSSVGGSAVLVAVGGSEVSGVGGSAVLVAVGAPVWWPSAARSVVGVMSAASVAVGWRSVPG